MSGIRPTEVFLLNTKHKSFLTGSERKLCDPNQRQSLVALLIVGIGAAVFTWAALTLLLDLAVRQQLKQEGITVSAQVVNQRTARNLRRGDSYFITYSFRAGPQGSELQEYRREEEVDYNLFWGVSMGGRIQVAYKEIDPSVSRLVDNPDGFDILAVLGSGLALMMLREFLRLVRQFLHARRLERDGQLLTGTLTDSKMAPVKGGVSLTVKYTFLSPTGAELNGKQQVIRSDLPQGSAALPPGTKIAVLYVDDRVYGVL